MKTKDFDFYLPKDLIAKNPCANRSDARMLVYQKKNNIQEHKYVFNLPEYFKAGDLIVLNNTKVIPARIYGKKYTGGAVEILVERILDNLNFLAHIRASKSPKIGSKIVLMGNFVLTVVDKQQDLYTCQSEINCTDLLDNIGQIPLPPYIDRLPTAEDINRYQTVYATHKGSVAAPTAGLHLTEQILADLQNQGVEIAYTTLHIGAGTFQPVRTELITDHKMHAEQYFITQDLINSVNNTKQRGGRVIAVGTTAMRSLESFATYNHQVPGCYETAIFIYPGYEFKLCDGLLTNFHLPQSTLLMLVSAFIGKDEALKIYNTAVCKNYRFFSYGDACLFFRD